MNKLTTTTETNLNILDNKIDAKTAELLAIIQVSVKTLNSLKLVSVRVDLPFNNVSSLFKLLILRFSDYQIQNR